MEPKKLTIQKIGRFTTDREGNALTTKDGRPYSRVILNTKEYPSDKISGFGSLITDAWKEGDVVEVIIEEKGEYLNFKVPKQGDAFQAKILNELTAMKLILLNIESAVKPKKHAQDTSEEDFSNLTDEDFPF